jgi:hypothetical protein
MLADPLFKNSRRFPSLLRYVVEGTLEGRSAEMKERTLGVEVFGREPNYDTNADPIVRATAGEIRKRIAQYYHEPEHQGEIRIDLSPGSYVPEFEPPAPRPVPIQPSPAPSPQPTPPPARRPWSAYALAASAAVALLIGVAWFKPWAPVTALDRFWRPVLESSNTVLLCIGQRSFMASSQEPRQPVNPDVGVLLQRKGPEAPVTLSELYYMGSQNVALTDARTLGRLTGLLESRGKTYRILGGSATSFTDLRNSPVILIGGFNNDWTIRLTGPMRFSLERDGVTFWIRDRQNPGNKSLAVNYDTPYLSLSEDYAVISRVLDPTTEHIVVIAAGLTGYGTTAAGEFLADPRYLEDAAKQAPAKWERKNIQWVIGTKVISGISGPPRVIDRYFW